MVGFVVLLEKTSRLTVKGACCGSDLIVRVPLLMMTTVGLTSLELSVDFTTGVVVIERNFCSDASPICKGLIEFLLIVDVVILIVGMIIALGREEETRIREDDISILRK